MAFLRNLGTNAGNLASQVLGYRLRERGARNDDERTQARQIDLAKLQAQLKAQGTRDDLLPQLLSHREQVGPAMRGGLSQVAGVPLSGLDYTPAEQQATATEELQKAPNASMLPGPEALSAMNGARPGVDMGQLQSARQERVLNFNLEDQSKIDNAGKAAEAEAYGQATGHAAGTHDAAPVALQDEVTKRGVTDPLDISKAAQQSGAEFDAQHTPGRMGAAATEAGMKAGAVSNAELPNQEHLAQVRADVSLQNQTAMDDYRRSHPKATSAALDQKAGADHALSIISDVRSMADEMDKRGLLGAVSGRAAELAAGTIKSDAIFHKPEDAQLAAQFFSEMGLLQKLTARVHGGVRAAASPMMAAQFDKILSGIGDRRILEGQLNAVEQVMKTYSDNPDAPPMLSIPGQDPTAGNQGPPSIDPSIMELLNRGKR